MTRSLGTVVTTYDPALRTRIYFPLCEPDKKGNIPVVPDWASSVLIYFHGSGTQKAGGRNFLSKMHALMAAGVAPIAIDLPFHSEGPIDSQFLNLNYFMEWVHRFVGRVRAAGKPIYMVGHSFGPFVIQEYSARYPKAVAGALLISAAGDYHPALRWTYQNVTMPGMKFIDETLEESAVNELGGKWAAAVESQATWQRRPAPETRLMFLRGSEDEWFPENNKLPMLLGIKQPFRSDSVEKWLRHKYPSAELVIAEGVGHYIFEHLAESGKNLILEKIFDLLKVEESRRFVETHPQRSSRELVALYYHNNSAFRAWSRGKYPAVLSTEDRAERTLKGWRLEQQRLWREMFDRIPTASPDFYNQRSISWEKLRWMMETHEWDDSMRKFQAEYVRYLEAKARHEPVSLGADPHRPKGPELDPKFFRPGEVGKWGVHGPVTLEPFMETLKGKGEILSRVDSFPLAKVTYRINGDPKILETTIFAGIEESQARSLIEQAFFNACEKNHWRLPSERWEGIAYGVLVKGIHHQGKIVALELSGAR